MTFDWTGGGCLDQDPDVFHPPNNGYGLAKKICDGCILRPPCLIYALETEAANPVAGRHGMYGGFNPTERAAIQGLVQNKGWSNELLASVLSTPAPVDPKPSDPRRSTAGI